MIQFADECLKPEVIFIWKTCFPEDPEFFVNFYFESVYKNANTLVYLHNKKVVACLQMIPYTMNFYGTTINVRYISGCATLPEFQHQGFMRKLLVFAFEEMKKMKVTASILIPQDENVVHLYEKVGYTTVFDYQEKEIFPDKNLQEINNEINIVSIIKNSKYKEQAYHYLRLKEQQQIHCVKHTFLDFQNIVSDYILSFGEIWVALQNDKIIGICFFVQNGNVVKEIYVENNLVEQLFLSHIFHQFNVQKIVVKKKAENNNYVSKGMVRIIDPEKSLAIFSNNYPNETILIKITDEQLIKNNQNFFIHKGKCKIVEQSIEEDVLQLNIAKLSQILFGKTNAFLTTDKAKKNHPYINLMLD